MSDICTCGQPRWTVEDMRRWFDEVGRDTLAGNTPREYNPGWARSICWTDNNAPCKMRQANKEVSDG